MRRIVLIGALMVLLSPGYAEAAERVWRLGVLTLADDSAARSIILPYLATRGFANAGAGATRRRQVMLLSPHLIGRFRRPAQRRPRSLLLHPRSERTRFAQALLRVGRTPNSHILQRSDLCLLGR